MWYCTIFATYVPNSHFSTSPLTGMEDKDTLVEFFGISFLLLKLSYLPHHIDSVNHVYAMIQIYSKA